MSRFDKYDPYSGGYRAALNAAVVAGNVGKMYAVSLNASGKTVIGGAALADLAAVICPVRTAGVNEVIDNMTAGEIVEGLTTAGAALTAGGLLYGHIDGTVDQVSASGKVVGRVAEIGTNGGRCIIRVAM
jgi:hypothetical protein